jgi:KDO2-lipid IV(A) lauroyltransferase
MKASYRIAQIVGFIAYYLLPKTTEVVLKNLRIAFGRELSGKQIKATARKAYQNLAKNIAEFAKLPYILKNHDRYIKLKGKEHLDNALKKGKGVILVTAHLGNWEILGAFLASQNYPLYAIIRPQDNYLVEDIIDSIREKAGIKRISRLSPVKGAFKCLKENGILAILIDQHSARNGVYVDFFGKPASTVQGPILFAQKTQAQIVPAFIFREGLIHQIEILKPYQIIETGEKDEDIKQNMAKLTKLVEERIRQNVDQWLWLHPRWRD